MPRTLGCVDAAAVITNFLFDGIVAFQTKMYYISICIRIIAGIIPDETFIIGK